MLRRSCAFAFVLVFSGCGYHLVGTASSLPPDLQTLYVERFTNLTPTAEVDQRVNEAVAIEWVRRRRFEIVESASDADVVLSGSVTNLIKSPVQQDDQGRATEYQLMLRAEVRLNDVRGEEPQLLWEDKGFSRRTTYEVDVTAADYFDREIEALDILASEFAGALVTAVLEGF